MQVCVFVHIQCMYWYNISVTVYCVCVCVYIDWCGVYQRMWNRRNAWQWRKSNRRRSGKFLIFCFIFTLSPPCSFPQVRIQNLMLKVIHVRSEFGLILISINKIWRGLWKEKRWICTFLKLSSTCALPLLPLSLSPLSPFLPTSLPLPHRMSMKLLMCLLGENQKKTILRYSVHVKCNYTHRHTHVVHIHALALN